MPKGVTCSVANCNYWEENNQCGAASIQIEIDAHANRNFMNEFANELLSPEHQDSANQSAETCCLTFSPKG
ncbi:MAG: DUF1540 domain-containing protein [Candidatus Pristimantibacillus lignocellulolyticus]|uniref:DUF1540 domain-containing protein n=1 Tax=Candidatus Pristimantibacillus lignocellulolyticus TaxID=2994561 RepID=A0A9J6ZE15_9BACL|nr:MAG: DUF1540 domain-containing protein [Candidatus Pristimantibacillus lignocellulolyticus]